MASSWFCDNLAHIGVRGLHYDAVSSHLDVVWRLPGDDRDAHHRWRVTVRDGRVVEAAADPSDGLPPLWALEPVTVHQHGRVTVLAGRAQQPPSGLTSAAEQAVRDVVAADLGELARDWRPGAVVEVPSSAAVLARMIGQPSDQTAALAWPWGEGSDSSVHILVNPEVRTTDPRAQRYLLAHELTHVATRAFARHSPGWAREGLAEHVATTQAGDVTGYRKRPTRAGWRPTDADLDPASPHVADAYAAAQRAVDDLIARDGWPAARAELESLAREGG